MYGLHPSIELQQLFRAKPYQGADPATASLIFLGLDANYSEAISDVPFFQHILAYHEDGVAFWKQHQVHHPFLLPDYPLNRTQGGVPYHRNFAKLGLSADVADKISFVELLDVPTIGSTTKAKTDNFYNLVSSEYLHLLDMHLMADRPKAIFAYREVIKRMLQLKKRYGVFDWLEDKALKANPIPILYDDGQTRLCLIYSFSSHYIHSQIPSLSHYLQQYLSELNTDVLKENYQSIISSEADNTDEKTDSHVKTIMNENGQDRLQSIDKKLIGWAYLSDRKSSTQVMKESTVLACILGFLSQSWIVFGICLFVPLLMSMSIILAYIVLVLRTVAWGCAGLLVGRYFDSSGLAIFLGGSAFFTAGYTSINAYGQFRSDRE